MAKTKSKKAIRSKLTGTRWSKDEHAVIKKKAKRLSEQLGVNVTISDVTRTGTLKFAKEE